MGVSILDVTSAAPPFSWQDAAPPAEQVPEPPDPTKTVLSIL